jgi:hypothetical protein
MTEAQLMEALTAAIEEAGGMEALGSFAMDITAAAIAEAPGGSRSYALIPTIVDILVEGQTMRARSETLGFEDENEWWSVRIDDPQQAQVLSTAYPEFAGVTFPIGAKTAVQ